MSSRQLMALVAGVVTLFILGFLVYGMAMTSFFEANQGSATGVMRDPPIWWAMIVSHAGWAGLLLYVFGRGGGVASFGDGAKVGAVVGLLAALAVDLILYSTTNMMNLTAALVDVVVWMVISGVTGGVVAAVLARSPAAPA